MLRAISDTTLNIDSNEYSLDIVPQGLLTESELAEVRAIHSGALRDFVVWQEPVSEGVNDDPDNTGWNPIA
jgi:hypothetical protein